MLDELSPHLARSKAADLLGRLEDKRADQALPAEMELALLWALSRLGEIEIEPEWFGTGRVPDAYSEGLFPGLSAFIEIAAVSDASLSGEEDMRRASRLISDHASKIKRRSGSYLYYRFAEESGYINGAYYRRRRVVRDFGLDDNMRRVIADWVQLGTVAGTRNSSPDYK
ncbi:MAG: hypothetical protein H0T75_02790 [Rhizobiales bacterium]|nr:hypothetical protein [Hyphomicrobiales bacterium]